jgi:hypothetical protein
MIQCVAPAAFARGDVGAHRWAGSISKPKVRGDGKRKPPQSYEKQDNSEGKAC